ncbi:uncharacterized protein FRV6_01882 [Fusarium oxysporum]|uniref:Uncharacterized protein n=1 Tax=Fusarium oxysporum TaxID=5507 RepID=A0A2H3T431_FUSOX|nr:uncharacterized protein FRV6_01882 [Fusarium oxysporum]
MYYAGKGFQFEPGRRIVAV